MSVTLAAIGWLNWSVFAAYLVVLGVVGILAVRRNDDFFLTDRRLPAWVAGVSIFATTLSPITYLAIPGKAYVMGWTYFPLNIGVIVAAFIVAALFIRVFRRLPGPTIYAYLEERFHRSLRIGGALVFLVYQVLRFGLVLLLPALALEVATGVDRTLAIAVLGVISIAYTAAGGMRVVTWTDILQALVLIGAIVGIVGAVALRPEGIAGAAATAFEDGRFRLVNPEGDWRSDAWWIVAVGVVLMSLPLYVADQTVAQRYLASASDADARRALWINSVIAIPVTALFFLVGALLYGVAANGPGGPAVIGGETLATADQVVPAFVARSMIPGLAGLLTAGVFAAAMSSLDSSLHAAATVVVHDLRPGRPFARPDRVARIIVVVLGVSGVGAAALLGAASDLLSILDAFISVLGLLLGPLTGVFLLGVLRPRARARDAWIGVGVTGALLVGLFVATPISPLLHAPIGIVLTLTLGVLTSTWNPTSAPAGD